MTLCVVTGESAALPHSLRKASGFPLSFLEGFASGGVAALVFKDTAERQSLSARSAAKPQSTQHQKLTKLNL